MFATCQLNILETDFSSCWLFATFPPGLQENKITPKTLVDLNVASLPAKDELVETSLSADVFIYSQSSFVYLMSVVGP